MDQKARDLVWGLGSAVVIVIGSLGPWATFGPFSVSGTSGDGVISLILGIAAVALILTDRWAWILLVAAVVTAVVGIYDTVDVSSAGNDFISPSPGWGVIVVMLAGISLSIWSGLRIAGRRGGTGTAGMMPDRGGAAPHSVDRP